MKKQVLFNSNQGSSVPSASSVWFRDFLHFSVLAAGFPETQWSREISPLTVSKPNWCRRALALFPSFRGGRNWARTWFSPRVSEKTSALREAVRDAFILYCWYLSSQECLFLLLRCSLLFYCGKKKKKGQTQNIWDSLVIIGYLRILPLELMRTS